MTHSTESDLERPGQNPDALSFEKRKSDHLKMALDPRTQATGKNGLDRVHLIPEALPEMNFSEVQISTVFQNQKLSSPIFISSMTAGHQEGVGINTRLARLSERRQILMGVGSQRRELFDETAAAEWKQIRKSSPGALLLGNLGLSQVIQTPTSKIQSMLESMGALGLFVHLNALQECLQPEGTPDFKGGLKALEKLAKEIKIPVIIKEVGCGFSAATLKRLDAIGVYAVDISGFGGTHWGRIEGYRSEDSSIRYQAAQTFANWGDSTTQSLMSALEVKPRYSLWASGGVRNGLEVAKLLALGADQVGLAQPFLEAALEKNPEAALDAKLDLLEYELKVSMFCTGIQKISDFKANKVWQWQNT